jgi:SAM-dependent methyltransferase
MQKQIDPKSLKEFYNCNPCYFEAAAAGVEKGALYPPHKRTLDYVRCLTGKRVCDFGCADGRNIEAMYDPGNSYVGLDVSEGALNSARARFSHSNVDYVLSDITGALPFQAGAFDVITSFYTFEHVLDPNAALNELFRLLKRDGELLLIMPNYGSPLKIAPPLGNVSKPRMLMKLVPTLITVVRRLLFPRAPLRIKMIPLDKLVLGEKWESDMDATNEPWSWEIAAYLENHGFTVEATSWEAELKTDGDRFCFKYRHLPLIKHFGPLCFIHARRVVNRE